MAGLWSVGVSKAFLNATHTVRSSAHNIFRNNLKVRIYITAFGLNMDYDK
jgi:hypothetical protein